MLQPRRRFTPSSFISPGACTARLPWLLAAAAGAAAASFAAATSGCTLGLGLLRRLGTVGILLLPAVTGAAATAAAATVAPAAVASALSRGPRRGPHEHGVDGEAGVASDAQALPRIAAPCPHSACRRRRCTPTL